VPLLHLLPWWGGVLFVSGAVLLTAMLDGL
jgi:hypothetical protein